MTIIRVPFQPEHFDLIEPADVFIPFKARMRLSVMQHGRAMSWIDVDAPTVLFCGGYVLRRPGVAWMWFLPSARGSRALVMALRFWRRWIATLEDGIRIEAHVMSDFEAGNRWAGMLGLCRENDAPLRKWDGREDYNQFARITGDG